MAAVLNRGKLLGLVPKKHIPSYHEFYEGTAFCRWLGAGGVDREKRRKGSLRHESALCLPGNAASDRRGGDLRGSVGAESSSVRHALAGATVLANLSASDEMTGKDIYRRDLVRGQSARLVAGYIYADAGEGESSTDLVFSAQNMIAEMEPCWRRRSGSGTRWSARSWM